MPLGRGPRGGARGPAALEGKLRRIRLALGGESYPALDLHTRQEVEGVIAAMRDAADAAGL